MGIQASLNQLTGTFWRGIAAFGTGVKALAKYNEKDVSQASQPKEVKGANAETTSSMGNIVKIGRVPRNRYASAASLLAANNSIGEKAPSVYFNVNDRIAEANFASNKEGGKK